MQLTVEASAEVTKAADIKPTEETDEEADQ